MAFLQVHCTSSRCGTLPSKGYRCDCFSHKGTKCLVLSCRGIHRIGCLNIVLSYRGIHQIGLSQRESKAIEGCFWGCGVGHWCRWIILIHWILMGTCKCFFLAREKRRRNTYGYLRVLLGITEHTWIVMSKPWFAIQVMVSARSLL